LARLLSERALWVLVLLGFLAGCPGLISRYQAERALAQTEILLDSQALLDWQLALKSEGAQLPEKLKAASISSLAFGELHLEDLVERGLATPLSFQELDLALEGGGLVNPQRPEFPYARTFNEGKKRARQPGSYLLFGDPQVAADVHRSLSITLGEPGPDGAFVSAVEFVIPGRVLFVPLTVRQLRLRSLGFENEAIRGWMAQGFNVWLRPENTPGLTPAQISALFKMWKEDLPGDARAAVQGIIFAGPLNQAIGYPDELETTAEAIQANGWKLGYIELPARAQQEGIEFLVRKLPQSTARVMAVSPAHQQKLSPFRVLGMYSLGARERNLRVLYVRPFAVAGRPELDEEFLFSLPGEIRSLGPASTFTSGSPPPHPVATALMSLGAGALGLLLLQALGLSLAGRWAFFILALPVLGWVAATVIGKSVLFRCLLALAVGMGGPTLAFLRLVFPSLSGSGGGTWRVGLRLLLLTSLASLLTGLWVAALLPDTTFLLGLDRFRGVKLLTLATPVLIVLSFLWRRYPLEQWKAGLVSSVKIYQAVLMGVLLAAFGILLLRTGNEAGATASDSERYLRVVLDQVLGVRPRFKEFLLAHPAMLCTPLVAWRLGFLPSLLMVLLAAIGQAGIVDTFAHVHTPLDVTLIRVVLGVLFGVLFGAVGYRALAWILARLMKGFGGSDEV
jgi:hypothetical protein